MSFDPQKVCRCQIGLKLMKYPHHNRLHIKALTNVELYVQRAVPDLQVPPADPAQVQAPAGHQGEQDHARLHGEHQPSQAISQIEYSYSPKLISKTEVKILIQYSLCYLILTSYQLLLLYQNCQKQLLRFFKARNFIVQLLIYIMKKNLKFV